MKILIDARLYGLENTGIGRYTINLISYLVQTDKKNEYIVLLRKKYFNQLNFDSNWTKILADYPHYSFSEQLVLPFLLYKLNPDLVHFLHLNVPILYWKKYILTVHDLLIATQSGVDTSTLPWYWYWIKRMILPAVFTNALKLSQKIIVPSNVVKEELLKKYNLKPNNIEVCYEGVSAEFLKNSSESFIPEKDKFFLYVGNLYPHKNIDNAIKALVKLNQHRARNNKIKLYIVTSRNVFYTRLMDKIQEFDVHNLVKVLTDVNDLQLVILYKSSLAYVFPSLSEGFGLPGIEALSSGTLLLASDIPVFKEVYKNHALYFDPNDVGSILELMNIADGLNRNDRLKRIEQGKKYSQVFTWKSTAIKTLEVYESVFK